MLDIRRKIKDEIERENFVDGIDSAADDRIKLLVLGISMPDLKKENLADIAENSNGDVEIFFKDGKKKPLDDDEIDLLLSLRLYFDSYRLAHNANKFRNNLDELQSEIINDVDNRKINFYSEKEKTDELTAGLKEKYGELGFSEKELPELIKTCNLKDLNDLPIYKIKGLIDKNSW